MHDPLTGLHNRVILDDVLARSCATDDRNGGGRLATLMIDIDHFKAVNDEHGHQVGDQILSGVAAAIERCIRPADLAVRYGGEEFLVLLDGIDLESASEIAERLRAEIATRVTDLPGVTTSIGLALHRVGEDPHHLIERADRALYRAKEAGRDRTVVA
ncbi:MAG: GGDEF domain-containing protein [Acidimicrobiales bacterium]